MRNEGSKEYQLYRKSVPWPYFDKFSLRLENKVQRLIHLIGSLRQCDILDEMHSNKQFKLQRKKVEPNFDLRQRVDRWIRRCSH